MNSGSVWSRAMASSGLRNHVGKDPVGRAMVRGSKQPVQVVGRSTTRRVCVLCVRRGMARTIGALEQEPGRSWCCLHPRTAFLRAGGLGLWSLLARLCGFLVRSLGSLTEQIGQLCAPCGALHGRTAERVWYLVVDLLCHYWRPFRWAGSLTWLLRGPRVHLRGREGERTGTPGIRSGGKVCGCDSAGQVFDRRGRNSTRIAGGSFLRHPRGPFGRDRRFGARELEGACALLGFLRSIVRELGRVSRPVCRSCPNLEWSLSGIPSGPTGAHPQRQTPRFWQRQRPVKRGERGF